MKIKAGFSRNKGELKHFWQGTGFTPALLLLHPAMRQTITYVGSIPHGGITYVRIHYLLEMVKVKKSDTGSLEYDWSELDKALDLLVENRLKPFFELMGNPSGYFNDFLDDTCIQAWRRLVRDLALHCKERYGEDEVTGWFFESWNEPDAGWFDGSGQGFLNYYDACSEGLKDADCRLLFGGPGTSDTLSDSFVSLLRHCAEGKNYFTGKKGVRLDFISVHEKGANPSPEDLNPDTPAICSRELKAIEYVRKNYQQFSVKPFMNNECDPQIGWSDFHTWHARPYYAAIVCKIIHQHLAEIIDASKCDYALLSNDNGFIGRWGNRSLLACFGEGLDLTYDSREFLKRPDPLSSIFGKGEFSLIKKPVFNAMVMLSLLGGVRCETILYEGSSARIGAIAAKGDENQITVLVYNSSDKIMSGGFENIDLHLDGLPFSKAAVVHYRIDEEHGDPYCIWEKNGASVRPEEAVLELMKENQELTMLNEVQQVTVNDGKLDLSFVLPLPGVSLLLLAAMPDKAPARVENIRVERYKGAAGQPEIMIAWKSSGSRFIRTYEVLFSDRPEGPFARVNKQDLICSAYLHAWEQKTNKGYYRVKAVDYWGRAGEESEIIEASSDR